MTSVSLPELIVIRVSDTYVYCRDEDGYVCQGQESIFSPLVKIQVEPAKSGNGNVHLRFCYNNKYWQKDAVSNVILATSNVPDEDTTKPTCTLFKPELQGGNLSLSNVYTGWGLSTNDINKIFIVTPTMGMALGYVDWSTLVKLPARVAIKGDNGMYLRSHYDNGHNWLQYGSSDANGSDSSHEISLMNDGYVRVKTDTWGLFWRLSPYWIWADSSDTTPNNNDTLFWPVKVDDTTIALKNKTANQFIKRLSEDGSTSCLNAATSTITTEAMMQVQELLLSRNIFNVVYRMDDARIYDETPYLAGTTTADNNGDEEASVNVTIGYENSVTSSFNRSMSMTAGVTSTITAGVPEIASTSIEISFQVTTQFDTGTSTTATSSISATGNVPVPAKSRATVTYVGTMGKCDVPFSYTQQDQSAADGSITQTTQDDGVYTGVNCYNFNFVIEKTEPLP